MAINGLVVGFYLIHGLLAILPSYALLRQYRYTEIIDYLLFCGAFFSSIIMSLGFILIEFFDKLFYYQLAYITQNFFYLFLFIHAINSIWEKKPWYIIGPGIFWFVFLEIYIAFWSSAADNFSFLSFSLDRSIQSDSYSMYGILYRIFVMLTLMYIYNNIEPIKVTKRINQAKILWIIAISIHLIFLFLQLMMIYDIFSLSTDYTVILNIVSIIIIWYIMIFMPEATLVSKVQLLRASKLYHKIQYMQSEEEEEERLLLIYNAPKLINNYLKSIPQEIWDDLRDQS